MEFLIIGLPILVLLVVTLPLMVRGDREMRRSLEESRAARQIPDAPFLGRYRILPIVGGYRIEHYEYDWLPYVGPRKQYVRVAEVQGSIEDARATVEHLSQPVEVVR